MRKVDPIQILLDEPIGGMTDNREEDLAGLGFGEYADVLAGVILGSASPFTMGVFGDWGTGKTTLMQMIRERLIDYAPSSLSIAPKSGWFSRKWQRFLIRGERSWRTAAGAFCRSVDIHCPKPKHPLIIPVWFEAWRHQGDEEIGLHLLHAIRDAAFRYGEYDLIRQIAANLDALERGFLRSLKFKTPFLDIEPGAFADEIDASAGVSTRVTSPYDKLKHYMGRFADSGDSKFVVFVDDLDRCLPEAALQVLECTKVFLGFKGMVWVLGLAREIVEACVDERYRPKDGDEAASPYGRDLGRRYMRKMVQVVFTIPSCTDHDLRELLEQLRDEASNVVVDLFKPFRPPVVQDQVRQEVYAALEQEWPDLGRVDTLYDYATLYRERNPREIKRLLNAFIVSRELLVRRDDIA